MTRDERGLPLSADSAEADRRGGRDQPEFLRQARRYLLNQSSVRRQASLAAASS